MINALNATRLSCLKTSKNSKIQTCLHSTALIKWHFHCENRLICDLSHLSYSAVLPHQNLNLGALMTPSMSILVFQCIPVALLATLVLSYCILHYHQLLFWMFVLVFISVKHCVNLSSRVSNKCYFIIDENF
jgi:uncharacterized oligopeptide transporter (OPT) family protein